MFVVIVVVVVFYYNQEIIHFVIANFIFKKDENPILVVNNFFSIWYMMCKVSKLNNFIVTMLKVSTTLNY
jgi:hypothetical protein